MPTTVIQWGNSALTTPLTTELNTLAHNTRAISAAQTPAGQLLAYPELFTASFSGTPGVSASVQVWFIKAVDGTNYERGDASLAPARNPDFQIVIPPTASMTNQRWSTVGPIQLPSVPYKVLILNLTGVAFAGSGNTLAFRPVTFNGVS